MKLGGIILCGGRSSRMGESKAWLPFGDLPMLVCVVRRLSEAAWPLVVVAAPDQAVPELSEQIRIVRDPVEGLGPLQGMLVGLEALRGRADAAFVTSCDAPLLRPELVQSLARQLDDQDAAVPVDDQFAHPLCAVYRIRVASVIRRLLEQGESRPRAIFDHAPTRRVPVDELRLADPDLDSLVNLNRPEDYQAALARAGLEVGQP